MARKWTNSKGLGVDYENSLNRSLDRLRREVMKPEVYRRVYNKNRNPQQRRDNKGKK